MAIVGIDLGTSNSLICTWEGDSPKVFQNALKETLTPSVVSVTEDGQIVVGRAAYERRVTHPQRTFASFKRAMGTSRLFTVGSHSWRAEDLSALILMSLKQDAEIELGEEVTEAVISVPAYFNDAQRKATLDAAKLAGLHVERLVNEPTAAALAHGLENVEEGTFLVLDLGGGTFDVSLLEKYDDVMEIRASSGDAMLGGDDFRDVLCRALIERHSLDMESLRGNDMAHLISVADTIKRKLTNELQAEYSFISSDNQFSGSFTREAFEELSQTLFQRMRLPITRVIRDSRADLSEIDQVVLVGGAARMPMVRRLAATMFGKLPLLHARPDHIIGIGAAVQAALKSRNSSLKETVMTDVCPFTLGTSVNDPDFPEGVSFSPIINRNAIVPISRVQRYQTSSHKQKLISLPVLQGESLRPSQNFQLGELEVNVAPRPAGEESVDVRFTYDVNGALEVEVTVVSTGKVHRKIFRNQANLTDAELEQRFSALESIKILPREQAENHALIAWAERLYAEYLGSEREEIKALIAKFERDISDQAHSAHDLEDIRERFSNLLRIYDHSNF